ncbi:hypothetical protein TRFO_00901 [Tritrichomonas foetus]|uniref:Leucine Rich Repeat family protein n=1 Tax=Tritrichomonas foetus TaxID=1144522 RepID=A0A1J4L290_9EUKA|nr:hypothetical protein TRFO_00901 [Tritrichomonas foetus]|eukprot:OHT17631.1 hypothetical protein TRFO_00901 [Tritrichomonas foetus]
MEIDKDLLIRVSPIVGVTPADIVICCVRIKVVKKTKKTKRALLATEYCVYLLEKMSNNKKINVTHKFKWSDLKEVELRSRSMFILYHQNGKIKVLHSGAVYLLKLIVNHIKHIILPHELPKFTIKPQIINDLPHLNDAFMRMFRYQVRCVLNQKLPTYLMKSLRKSINYSELNIQKLPASALQYIDVILSCLQVEPGICSIVLPKTTKTFWTKLATVLQYNTTIRTLVSSDSIDSSIKKTCEAIASNKNSNLHEFAFIDNEITEKQLHLLAPLLTASNATSIYFERAFKADVMEAFITNPSYTSCFKRIQSLTLKSIPGLKIKSLFKKLKNMKALSLIDCNVNVVKILKYISNLTYTSICIIGGTAKVSPEVNFDPNSKLNPNLASLTFSDIKWDSSNTFIAAWRIFMTCQSDNFTLILNNEKVPDWKTALDAIGGSGTSKLDSFSWDNNQLDESMLPFFTRSTNLRNLSILGSLTASNVSETSRVLAKMPKLKILVVDGNENKLNASSIIFLREFAASKSIEKLSFRSHNFGDVGMNELATFLVKNTSLQDISFDDNKITKPETYIRFFENVMNRGPPLKFVWPESELREMRKNKLLKMTDINHMKECYDVILNGNESVEVTDEILDIGVDNDIFDNDIYQDVNDLIDYTDNDNDPKENYQISNDAATENATTENDYNDDDNDGPFSVLSKDESGPFSVPDAKTSTDKKNIQKAVFENVEWHMDLPEIEEFNDQQLFNQVFGRYSLSALCERLKNSQKV